MKLNLGSHNKKIEGYVNVDALDLPNVDYICDITKIPWFAERKKGDGDDGFLELKDIEEILMVEVLEHISWRDTVKVLTECHRILKDGGTLKIQVPDCGIMMKAYCAGIIDDVIPHKVQNKEATIELQKKTKKLVNPMRWLMAFCGAQKHKYDAHLNIFTKERLENNLEEAGFSKIHFEEDPLQWKIIVKVIK